MYVTKYFSNCSFWVIPLETSRSNEMVISLLLLFTKVITLVTSAPTVLIPKSTNLFSAYLSSSFSGHPSPEIGNSILWSPLISKMMLSLYFLISLGVKMIGIVRIFCSGLFGLNGSKT